MRSESPRRPPDPQLEGKLLDGRYQVEDVLGSGGIGVVYRAVDRATQRPVALKALRELSGAGEELRRRFEREVRALSALEHPCVVAILDSAASAEVPYFVMELLQGQTLRASLRGETPLSWPRARRIFLQLLDGLAYVHGRGLLHRDLKPENVFLVPSDTGERVKLLDFGLAKFVEASAAGEASLTRTGEFFGTPGYMAPERFLEQRTDIRGDVYCATLLLYEMLAGQRPFFGSVAEVAKQQITGRIRDIAELRPNIRVAPELKALFERGMAVEITARFASIAELRQAFEALPEPPLAPFWRPLGHAAVEPSGREAPPPRPRRVGRAWLVGAALVLGAGLGWPLLRAQLDAQAGEHRPPAAVPVASAGPAAAPVASASPAPSASPAASAPAPSLRWQAPAADPWAGPVSANLAALREQLDQGSPGDDAMVAALARHNREDPRDPRGHLLLARLYRNRGNLGEMVNQYEFAVLREPTARGDAHMLDDLLALHDDGAWDEASQLIAETYGAEAKEPVTRRLGEVAESRSRERLVQLLDQITSR